MKSNTDLQFGVKIALIIVGVVHLLLGLTVLFQALGERMAAENVIHEFEKINSTRIETITKEATIAPAVLMPFIAGTICLISISVCVKQCFICIIGANILELLLFIVALIRSHIVYSATSDAFDILREADKAGKISSEKKKFYDAMMFLELGLEANIFFCYSGLFLTIASIAVTALLAFKKPSK
ncbi:unnamed protein product [Caenorhabditis angaria]|uniref:Uncharacterized protein n=1 Tax=Caenorhabditis angaria TaxID=860376 RepID=A0A9P1N1U7_9PELO|nr:unnamed protein product [Caenorhabditis angaria]